MNEGMNSVVEILTRLKFARHGVSFSGVVVLRRSLFDTAFGCSRRQWQGSKYKYGSRKTGGGTGY